MSRRFAIGGALALGAALLLAPAQANAATAAVLHPSDFDHDLSDTRATGHYAVVDSSLRVWTEGATSTDKVAEYVDTSTPLAGIGEPTLDYTATTGATPPGFQLVVDFDGDGSADGILVGEPTFYGNDWWLNNDAAQSVKDAAPSHDSGFGSANHGTLDQWSGKFPDAVVTAFGFSLGSGVLGDWNIDAIDFNATRYTFADEVVLRSKDECKGGGWVTSTVPRFRNQGQCVSFFASKKK